MKRRDFIKQGCTACMVITGIAALVPSCAPGQFVTGKLNNDGLLLNAKDFQTKKNGKDAFRPHLVVRNEQLKFPVCVYRFSDTDYSALWMECAHQGAEVNVAGSYLQCPAHGSEFDNRG